METVTYSGPVDATSTAELDVIVQALASYVAEYGHYNLTDYSNWESILGAGVNAGNVVVPVYYGNRVYFIECDPSIANVSAVQFGSRVILIETSV